jgi:hypothetical protein
MAELCRHRGCTCAAKSDGYCSAYCAGRGDSDEDEGDVCACAHDECQAPTKSEGWGAVAELAPEGRFVAGDSARDW